MVPIGDLARLWSWGCEKWWHFPVAITIILILFIIVYLELFVKTEDRIGTLVNWYNGTATCFGTQCALADYYSELILAIILSAIIIGSIFTLMAYKFNKYVTEKVNTAERRTGEIEDAYINLRHAYRNALGIKVREVPYGMGGNAVKNKSKEYLQSMNHHDLYIEAERLAREAEVPADA